MRDALAVARLELREWRAVPALALGAGTLTAIVTRMDAPADLKNLAGLILSVCWPVAALVAGAGVFTRDLREGRAAFLCARGLPMRWVWAGKLLAALVLAATAWTLLSAPVWLVMPLPRLSVPVRVDVERVAVLTVLLIGLGHWIALASAARGRRLLADVVLSVLLLSTVTVLTMWLWFAGALPWSTETTVLACCALLTVAGAAAVIRGRGGRSASYAAFTTAHWVGLAALAAVEALNLHVIRSVGPDDLERPLLQVVSPGGEWVSLVGKVAGPPRKSMPTLLVSVTGPDVINTGRASFWEGVGGDLVFSQDGRWCAWPVLEWIAGLGSQPVVRLVELKPGTPLRSRRTPLDDPPDADAMPGIGLSPSGRGMLLVHPRGRIEALAGEDLRTLWKHEGGDAAGFLDDDNVFILRRGSGGRELVTLGLMAGDERRKVTLGGDGISRLVLAPTGSTALALTGRKGGPWLVERCDLARGECRPLWEGLDEAKGSEGDWGDAAEGAFLSDGGVVIVGRPQGTVGWEVRAFEPDDRVRWTLPLPAHRLAPLLIGEPRPGTLIIQAALPAPEAEQIGWPHPVYVVGAADGKVRRTETAFLPPRMTRRWHCPFRWGRAATYFAGDDGAVWRLDPETGSRDRVPLG